MNNDFTILIIDDEQSQRDSLQGFLENQGFITLTAENGKIGVEKFKKNKIDFVLSDFKMPDLTGEEVLEQIKEINPLVPVVIQTAYGTIEKAVSLMQKGASTYLTKPIDLLELLNLIKVSKENKLRTNENEILKQKLSEKLKFDFIVSNSSEMEEILNTSGRIAKSKVSILIRGESGTGKELIAKAIHLASDRSEKPFVVVNCAALPETLFESELFGHEKGAFTGAVASRIGKFEEANGGTLFIDEIGDIPLPVQVKLLRSLQFGEIQRLGSNKIFKLDVRIISATNQNLEQMISLGEFREDLLYRINVISLNLPPLRKRKMDIPFLIQHFIQKYSEINMKNVDNITAEALDYLMKYNYPGNIRELENIIQHSVVLSRDNFIKTEDLPKIILPHKSNFSSKSLNDENELGDLNEKVELLEKRMIYKALEETNQNQSKAAELLNISERTLRYKLSKYGKPE
jgi:two-component system NtrC family response regulator